jgi:hypothetical protein
MLDNQIRIGYNGYIKTGGWAAGQKKKGIKMKTFKTEILTNDEYGRAAWLGASVDGARIDINYGRGDGTAETFDTLASARVALDKIVAIESRAKHAAESARIVSYTGDGAEEIFDVIDIEKVENDDDE